jgi:hypothetical protein
VSCRCSGLQESLKYFIKFANLHLRNSETKGKENCSKGGIDELKIEVEGALRSLGMRKSK